MCALILSVMLFLTHILALVAFDYVITMDQEVNMVWRKKWTAATWLFITNRYLLVLVMVLANVHATATTSVYYRFSSKARH